jgi:hypothetical protein
MLVVSVVWSQARIPFQIVLCLLLVGCTGGSSGGPPITTGGDTPLTVDRLRNVKLTHIKQDITWEFTDNSVVIENNGKPIPADLFKDFIADETTPLQIQATWKLDSKAGILMLTDITVDGEQSERETELPISPAGHVRINLGGRQYNRFAGEAKKP